MRRVLKMGLGLAVATLFVWLALRHMSWSDVTQSLRQARPSVLALALLVFGLGYACRALRWRDLLRAGNPRVRLADCAGPLLACVAANNVLPLRAGDVLRAFAFNRRLGIDAATALSTLLVERLLDLLMLLLLLGTALFFFQLEVSRLVGLGAGGLLAAGGAVLLFLLRPSLLRPVAQTLVRAVDKLHPGIARVMQMHGIRVFEALSHAARGRVMLRLMGWSLMGWLCEATMFYLVALALPALREPLGAWLAMPVGTLSTMLPGAPGYVGTFHYFAGRVMVLTGNVPAAATAYALLVHALLWLPPTLFGATYLLTRPLTSLDKSSVPV